MVGVQRYDHPSIWHEFSHVSKDAELEDIDIVGSEYSPACCAAAGPG